MEFLEILHLMISGESTLSVPAHAFPRHKDKTVSKRVHPSLSQSVTLKDLRSGRANVSDPDRRLLMCRDCRMSSHGLQVRKCPWSEV